MHAPPPVRVTVAPDRPWIVACAAIASLTAANLVAWGSSNVALLLAAALAAGLCAAGFARRRTAPGALAWNGEHWLWERGGCEPFVGTAAVAIDLDRWMLLCFVSQQGRRHWLALSRGPSGAAWSPLRAALYAAQAAPAP